MSDNNISRSAGSALKISQELLEALEERQTQDLPQAVLKRDGRSVPYKPAKICHAIEKAFKETSTEYEISDLLKILADVEANLGGNHAVEVEQIQDLVELALMEENHFKVAKAYILYRELRRQKRKQRFELLEFFPELPQMEGLLLQIEKDYPEEIYSLSRLSSKYQSFHKDGTSLEQRLSALIRAAVELTDQEAPNWEFIAGRLYGFDFQRKLEINWSKPESLGISNLKQAELFNTLALGSSLRFSTKVKVLTELGLYAPEVLENYSEEDLDQAAQWLEPKRDNLLSYSGYDILVNRYVIRSHRGQPLENVQEMFLGIALFLAVPESKEQRLVWVKRIYDMLSSLQVTMATPTMANARKAYHQLSSCFIDTVPDSLNGIYRSITSFARVSKFGGGMGLYFGKVRAHGSPIRGFEGAAGGVIRWIRLANDTAVAVDQLGVRQGAVAVYLDVWHKDLPEFLDLRTNNGDDRMKAHDVFPAVCYPDYFWEQVEHNINGEWLMFCPYEIQKIKGYALEDYYGEEWTKRYLDCVADARLSRRSIPIKELVRLIIRSLTETGTPFAFNRDAVNRANPNKHKGMIYCSNLCTEIAQNMAPAEAVSEEIINEDGDIIIQSKIRPGEFVVCNLASITLGKAPVHDDEAMEQLIETAVRALDNVISMNQYPLPDAQVNNERYRPIGLGVSGYHHLLAKEGLAWESDAHLAFADKLFEKINYFTIKASLKLAREKGRYQYFAGSDWENGAYFESRGYTSEKWRELAAEVAKDGLRNGYLLAIAPTASTSIVSGTTPGVDPIMNRFFYDEKKNGLIPRVAPDLKPENYWLYKNAHSIDQSWLVRAGAIRARHIDQASSMNLYITPEFSFREILHLYIQACKMGVKTVYYTRSKSLEVEACESCAN